jgi:putative Holliday junction resolvase
MNPSYVLALDVGERRIGVALASTIARLAAPLPTIDLKQTPDAYQAINSLVSDNNASVVVVGLPRDMKGEDTAQTTYCRKFAAELGEKLNIPVVLQDETATSLVAEERLKASGKPYEKADIDAYAAVIILQDYLSSVPGHSA